MPVFCSTIEVLECFSLMFMSVLCSVMFSFLYFLVLVMSMSVCNVSGVYVNVRVYLCFYLHWLCVYSLILCRYCYLQAYHFIFYVAVLASFLSCTLVSALFTMVLYWIRLASLKRLATVTLFKERNLNNKFI